MTVILQPLNTIHQLRHLWQKVKETDYKTNPTHYLQALNEYNRLLDVLNNCFF